MYLQKQYCEKWTDPDDDLINEIAIAKTYITNRAVYYCNENGQTEEEFVKFATSDFYYM